MDSCSRRTLFLVEDGITEWRRNQRNLIGKIPWTESHVSTVRIYILKLNSIKSDFQLLSSAKDSPFSREIVESFIQKLKKFFVVPKLRQLYGEDNPKALKKNELFAAFLSFLLELLHQKICFVHSFEDQIEDLKKELRFLVTVLGDTLLINDELEQVNNLLAEFEQVANEAGNLVYSFIFAMDGVYLATRMEVDLNALFDHIHPLKASIIKFSNLVDDHTTRKTVVVHSLFIVDSLLCNLEDLMNKPDDRIVDVKEQIKAFHQELVLSKSLLDDINLQRCREIEEVMTRIRDVGYEAEYLINSFLVGDAPPWYLTMRLAKVIHKIRLIRTEPEKINIRVLEVVEDMNAQQSLQGRMHHEVHGFTIGLECKAFLDQLVWGLQHRQIIIISGMPGLGKTTLAKKLYNHPTVNHHFDRCIWHVVSQTYQRRRLLIDITISLASELDKVEISNMEEEEMGELISESLKGRRYLIIMDDVWDSKAWDDFRRYFPDDRNGSRVLLTSRNEGVAPPESIIYKLPLLSNDQCWELLQKKVFHDEPCPLELQWIGKEIAKNCHGLPLAVVVAAGILSTMDKEERTWKNMGQNLASYIFSDKNNSMMQILKLSYKHLPEHLKPCFLYFGAFPEDEEIPVKKLKYLWIAEGFIPNCKMLRTAEDVAERYLMELIGRSLLVVAKRGSDGGVKACVVHDLLRELCLRIAEEENFLKLMEDDYPIYTRHPRQHVRFGSFQSFGLHSHSLFFSILSAPQNFVNMKLLKLLVLPWGELHHGDGSENLVHLRYLVINDMPASIGSLGNLEFLTVMDSGCEVSIPSAIEKLTKLKYLSVPIAYFDKNCSNYRTNNLEFLSNVYIEKLEDENMLKCSPHLRKLKCTLDMLNHCLDLSFLTQLESLNASNLSGLDMVEINFPPNIRKLTLSGLLLPWEKMTTIGRLPKLEVLKLENDAFVGERWDTRDGEFQQLKFLKLSWMTITEWNLASIGHFPRLQRLVLGHCFRLIEIPWEVGEIPTLQLIELGYCQNSVAESAMKMQQEQQELGNEDLRVIIYNITDSFRRSPYFPDVVYNLGGEKMDSCSRETLLLVYLGISRWRSNQGYSIGKIPWSESHVSTVCFYILKLNSITYDFKLLSSARDLPFSREIVESFIQELQKFFMVPKLHQLYGEDNPKVLKKNEFFAAFISFLLELLHQKIDLVHSFEDRIEELKKELRFLLTILGDTLLIDDELEQVNNLLAEFEQVANEAGNLTYSLIFAMDGVYLATRMDNDLNALFDHIHLLKDDIIKSSNLVDDHTTRKTVVVHSLFIVDSLIYNLGDLMNKHDHRIVDVKEQIKALRQELMLSKSLLDDIKLQQCTEIEEAMTRIRDVGYEAEYLINSFSVGDASLWYLTIRLPKVIHKIKLIGTELEEIKKKCYKNRVLEVEEDVNAQPSLQGKMHCQVDAFTIGLEDEANHVLDHLVGGPQHLQIIIIYGMPGLGKTTLAKKLYNQPIVECYFDRRTWQVVSQTYQRKSLLIDILSSLPREYGKFAISNMEEERLGECIYKSLKGRRYLIVMDDVWDSNAWDDLRRYFPDDRNGSRILLTSRNEDVAPPNSIILALPSLSNDQCWELLQKQVFRDEPCPPELQWIGKEIAKNCHGLPLAVVVTAGILSTMDKEERTWKNVGEKLVSYIFSDKNNFTMQILELSYKHLPEHLKPCFLYVGAFLEDAEIPVKKLKYLWIAEGFIPNCKMLRTAEDVAEQYLMELIDRGLLVVAKRRSDGGAKACLIHDLLREFCLRIAEEENFLKLMEHDCSIYTRHPRQHVRDGSFLSFGLHSHSLFGSLLEAPLNFVHMKLLKLLVLPRGELGHGDGSENLVHLRYLVIKDMPASIGSLGNLEFLTVMDREYAVHIPSEIENLTKLKYLSIPTSLFNNNCNNHQTNNLEFLSDVYIEDENTLKCSPHLRKLKCELCYNWKNRCLDLSFLTQLESLSVRHLAVVVINFPLNIRKLRLSGLLLPWEKMTTIGRLPKLEVLKLKKDAFVGERWDTRDGEFQRLKFLKLRRIRIIEWNVASSEHFPRLQRLVLADCSELKEIPCAIGEIATLQSIEVLHCQKSVAESATEIQEKRWEMGNEELRVISYNITDSFLRSTCFPDVVCNLGGENMDSCSRETLFLVYRRISGWRSNPGNLIGKIRWGASHVSTVCFYILKLNSIKSDFKVLSSAKDLPFLREIVESFIQELQKFFVVPKLHQLYGDDNPKALKKNELFAAFLSFLLELLHQKIRLVHSFKDQIEDLKKELRFLLTVLGDTLLINDELEQVNNLLVEFEQVANEAGNFVYFIIFAMDGVYLAKRMEDDLNALFDHIHLLKDNITKFSILVDDHATRKTVVVHSLFIVDSLLYNLEDLMNKDDDRIVDVKEQIRALHQELMLSKSLLDNIKLQRCIEIEEAMTGIIDVGYEAEYLINSFSAGDAPLWYLAIRLSKVIQKIELIRTELEEIKKKYCNIRVFEVAVDVNEQPSFQGKIHCHVDGFTIGLEDKTTRVLHPLVGEAQDLRIIIISGMPGLGKTTLARKLYNQPIVECYFDRRTWQVVSQTYQRKSLLIDILSSLSKEHGKEEILHMTEAELGENIYKSLKERRYLIVMDDVWDSNAWDDFRRYFPDDRNGSRILLTSRNEDVAPPNSIIYKLPFLSNDQCWELLQKKVFHDEPCPLDLQRIGKEIAKNCHGLPLAVVVAAGILSTMDKQERTWKNVGEELASYIFSDKNNSTMQILKLSYEHLPEHLKPCFLYLGAFPEDAEIPVKKLKYLWIAEGFIPNCKMLRTAEDVAEQYLMELVGRSLVVVAKRRSDGGAKACLIHDLLREFCLRIAEEENFLMLMEDDYSIYTRHPRQHVRAKSFQSFGLHICSLFGSLLEAPLNFVNMKLLKLLVLPRGKLSHGDGSENLVHLRYLVIKDMPASIGSLGNLEFLTMMDRQYEVSISSVIEKLMKLKSLSVPRAYFDKNCSNYQTNNLEFLSDVSIGKLEDENMLKCSPHLRKLKCTLGDLWENHCLDLSFLTQLESLNVRDSVKMEINFPLNIRKLRLSGLQLPWEKMTTIGRLPKLEVLKLEGSAFVGERWDTRDDEFQQLKFLKLSWIGITEWNVASSEHFPRLQRLVLEHCFELMEIPCEISEIATLELIEVRCCRNSLAESATKIQEEQREMGNEELRVITH